MKLVDTSIKKPVTVAVGVLLLVLFGFISLYRIPIQLTPNIDLPEVSIFTTWRGASPVEVEREIVDAQEEELKNLDGLVDIKSESQDSNAFINLMFEIGTDTDDALLRVSNSLERVKEYPDDVEKPIIKSGGRREQAMLWMVLKALDGYQGNLMHEFDLVDEYVKPRLERISGVASSNIYGGQEREIQVVVDSDALSARRVTIPELVHALDIENKNISAGDFDEGKRRYIARTVGGRGAGLDILRRRIAEADIGFDLEPAVRQVGARRPAQRVVLVGGGEQRAPAAPSNHSVHPGQHLAPPQRWLQIPVSNRNGMAPREAGRYHLKLVSWIPGQIQTNELSGGSRSYRPSPVRPPNPLRSLRWRPVCHLRG